MAQTVNDVIKLEYGVIKCLCVEREQIVERCMRNIPESIY